jgi:succinyl-diaminopimelate desuccinylase
MPADASDPVALARRLIACRSVTPADGGAMALLAGVLQGLGFEVETMTFGPADAPTPNLFARVGHGAPHVCFAGHTDVVPPGAEGWTHDPFEAVIADEVLYGRGACDMKGAIASFVAAVAGFLRDGRPAGTISLLITGDEEGPARFGTRAVVERLDKRGALPDFCLVGEPTNPATLGETVKIGRRGSLNATIEVRGVQGHVAYPDRADNPAHRLVRVLGALLDERLDEGTEQFSPSSLQVTSIDIGNPTSNIIPARAGARLNIRFNDRHDGAALAAWLDEVVARHAPDALVETDRSAEPFLSEPGPETASLIRAIRAETGREAALDTGGGTSDARFLAPHCRVAEFGLVGASMHQIDERVPVAELRALSRIYRRWLDDVMPTAGAA